MMDLKPSFSASMGPKVLLFPRWRGYIWLGRSMKLNFRSLIGPGENVMLAAKYIWNTFTIVGIIAAFPCIYLSQSRSTPPAKSDVVSSPCKYQTVWLDPSADGSPQGREFIKKVAQEIKDTGMVRLVKS